MFLLANKHEHETFHSREEKKSVVENDFQKYHLRCYQYVCGPLTVGHYKKMLAHRIAAAAAVDWVRAMYRGGFLG